MKSKKLKNFVSEIHQFFKKFDQLHPLSASQQAEIDKYQEIYQQRDASQVLKKVNA